MPKVTTDALKEVITSLAESANKEREKSDSYKDMFKKTDGVNFEGLLRDAEMKMMETVLNVCQVIETKTGTTGITKELWDVLLALPFVEAQLEKEISAKEGSCCCVDKAYYLLNEFVKNHLKEKK